MKEKKGRLRSILKGYKPTKLGLLIDLGYIIGFALIIHSIAFANTWCYQETANISTACGGESTGRYEEGAGWGTWANAIDGDWGTQGEANAITNAWAYINYTRPPGATNGSYWQTKTTEGSETNRTLPQNCWVQAVSTGNVELQIESLRVDPEQVRLSCKNSTGWNNFANDTSVDTHAYVYEEGAYWNMSVIINETYANSTQIASGEYARLNASIWGNISGGANATILSPNGTTSTGAMTNTSASHFYINCSSASTVCNTSQSGTFELVSITAGSPEESVTKTITGTSFISGNCQRLTFRNFTLTGSNLTNATAYFANNSMANFTNVNNLTICSSSEEEEITTIIFNNQNQMFQYIEGSTDNVIIYPFQPTESIVISTKDIRTSEPLEDVTVRVTKSNGTAMLLIDQFISDSYGEMLLNCTLSDELIITANKTGYYDFTKLIMTKDYLGGFDIMMRSRGEWYQDRVTIYSGGTYINELPTTKYLGTSSTNSHTICYKNYRNSVLSETRCSTGKETTYTLTVPSGTTSERMEITTESGTGTNITYTINTTSSTGIGWNLTADDFRSGTDTQSLEIGFSITMLILWIGLSKIMPKQKMMAGVAILMIFSWISLTAQAILLIAGMYMTYGFIKEHTK